MQTAGRAEVSARHHGARVVPAASRVWALFHAGTWWATELTETNPGRFLLRCRAPGKWREPQVLLRAFQRQQLSVPGPVLTTAVSEPHLPQSSRSASPLCTSAMWTGYSLSSYNVTVCSGA